MTGKRKEGRKGRTRRAEVGVKRKGKEEEEGGTERHTQRRNLT